MYGYLVTTYESASLRRFRNGRVDNIRSAHGAAHAWAAAMCTAETPPLNEVSDDGQRKVSFNLYGVNMELFLTIGAFGTRGARAIDLYCYFYRLRSAFKFL